MTLTVGRGTRAGIAAALVLTGFASISGTHPAAVHTASAASGANVDWPHFGNNTDNNRYSELTQINPSNVNQLGIAWTQQEGANETTFETNPIVVNGVMYYSTNNDTVRAVDGATGKLIWQYTPTVNFYLAIGGGGGGVPTNRGVEVANGRIYLLTFDDQLIALQQATGEKLWSSQVADPNAGFSETSPPTYWNGLLFVGSAESDAGKRGFVAAYDANTGKRVWQFWTVPAPGQGWVPKTPLVSGGDVWMPNVIDTKTGILYFGTGNPYPDFDNSHRPGCDPWVNAIVALDAKTGKLIWAHSEFCNDVTDYDSMPSPMIFDMAIGHKVIHAVGHANKSGLYFVYDAATGKVLSKSTYVTGYSHPVIPAGSKQAYTVCPGYNGGFEYSPAAYNPTLQAVYDPAVNDCLIFKGPSVSLSHTSSGTMAAIDVTTGKYLWRTQVSKPMVGGAVATASGLVFSPSANHHFYAFDAKTGKILWSPNLGVSIGAPPITYEVNGVQYIALAAGGFSSEGFFGDKNLGGTLVVFKLNGAPITKLPVSYSGFTSGLEEVVSLKGYSQVSPTIWVNKATKSVAFKVTAAATTANNGFNFNGYAKGAADFIVPVGWSIHFIFTNNQALPHSLALTNTVKIGPTTSPVAQTPDPVHGLSGAGTQYASVAGFFAPPAGNYYIVCLVPGHAAAGMWDKFTISATATAPSIVTQ